jgi:hypothetical protein
MKNIWDAMIYSIPAVIVLFGIVLVTLSFNQPRYRDPDWQKEFVGVNALLNSSGELSRKFYEVQAKNLTPAARRWDQGIVITSLGLSVTALLLILRIQNFHGLRELKTLSTPRAMRWLAITAWWAWVPAQWAWFSYTYHRGDYPWWADSIAIPIGGAVFFCLLGFPLVLWGAYVSTRGISLPVNIMQTPKTVRGLIATAVLTVPLAWFAFVGVRAFMEGDIFTPPVSVGGVYATMALWAAACAPRSL